MVAQRYRPFVGQMEAVDRPLPWFVRREFEAYLKCGLVEHGFLRGVRGGEAAARAIESWLTSRSGHYPGGRRGGDADPPLRECT